MYIVSYIPCYGKILPTKCNRVAFSLSKVAFTLSIHLIRFLYFPMEQGRLDMPHRSPAWPAGQGNCAADLAILLF